VIKGILALLFVLVSGVSASLYEQNTQPMSDLAVLRSFDIDENFLQDPHYLNLRNNYQLYQSTLFLQILSDAYVYFPMIRQKLAEANLPASLVYMAMAESNFRTRAYSSRRAVGIWQFMPATAKRFGLEVNSYVDERRDPLKSTDAAITYLKYLHKRFGKWYLAMMAYNCGEGRVDEAIRKAKSDRLDDLLVTKKGKRRQLLPRETRKYIRKIVAMTSIAQSDRLMLSSNHLHLLNRGNTSPLAKVSVPSGTTLKEIARAIRLEHKELRNYNSFLRYDFTPPYGKEHSIYIPYDKVAAFKSNYTPSKKRQKFVVYHVKRGDTLGGIGRKFKIPYGVIKDFNGLRNNTLSINQRLVIPVEKVARKEYIVRVGDTLRGIAKRFKTTVESIKRMNKKEENTIYAGEKLLIRP